jgi:hypothetical protein
MLQDINCLYRNPNLIMEKGLVELVLSLDRAEARSEQVHQWWGE